jgi:16S rRNA (guanine527-N7)-methyltransferase
MPRRQERESDLPHDFLGPARPDDPQRLALTELLEAARRRGFLGPGPVEDHIGHAEAVSAHMGPAPERALDLGTGAGIPGLVLALLWPGTRWTLLDGSLSRGRWLTAAVAHYLPDASNVEVVTARAEDAGRSPLRGKMSLVVARGFGRPAVTAECGAPFLRLGGRLVVTEPPAHQGGEGTEGGRRWESGGLELLGLTVGPRTPGPPAMQTLVQARLCPERYPRRTGVPAKRPLF